MINNEINYYSNFLKINFVLLNKDFFTKPSYIEYAKKIKELSKKYSFNNAKKEYHSFLEESETHINVCLITSVEDIQEMKERDIRKIQIMIDHKLLRKFSEKEMSFIENESIVVFTSYQSFLTNILNAYKQEHEKIKKDEFQLFYENNANYFEKEKQNFEHILNNIDLNVYLDFETFEVENYNDTFFNLFQEEIILLEGNKIFDFFHKDEVSNTKYDIVEAMKLNLTYSNNIQFKINKTKKILKTTMFPLMNNNMEYSRIFCHFVDITEEVFVQEDLLLSITELENQISNKKVSKNKLSYNDSEQTFETTLAMIAHQWRQPLTSISLIVDDVQIKEMLGLMTKEILKEDLLKIGKNVDFLSNTIDNFRSYLQQDKKSVIINVATEIKKATDTLIPLLTKNNVELVVSLDGTMKVKEKDGEIKQITMNLIKNSFDAFPKNQKIKKIIVNVSKKHGQCMIVFNDNAGGIPQQIVDRIWEPYFSTKKDLNGTGLGLYMVKNMVEKHMKGKILLKNDNKGASFVLLIPHIVI